MGEQKKDRTEIEGNAREEMAKRIRSAGDAISDRKAYAIGAAKGVGDVVAQTRIFKVLRALVLFALAVAILTAIAAPFVRAKMARDHSRAMCSFVLTYPLKEPGPDIKADSCRIDPGFACNELEGNYCSRDGRIGFIERLRLNQTKPASKSE